MAEPKRKPASYEDVLRAPEHMVAEIVEGDGPGGWVVLVEPELHLKGDVLVPDLAAWRKERAPLEGDEPYFTVVPDWVCEISRPRRVGSTG
jgi:hypothetical protein